MSGWGGDDTHPERVVRLKPIHKQVHLVRDLTVHGVLGLRPGGRRSLTHNGTRTCSSHRSHYISFAILH